MRRDMELVRRILIAAEESDCPLPAAALSDARTPEAVVARHIALMRDAGLVRASVEEDLSGNVFACVRSLTWEGHDYLAAVRSDAVWGEVKRRVASKLGDAALDTMKAVAVSIATRVVLGG